MRFYIVTAQIGSFLLMETSNEQQRLEFSHRLTAELTRIQQPTSSPTKIARAFSVRFPELAVTAQTMRKWLLGDAIPVQAKLLALAEWFDVSAQWLRYGLGDRTRQATNGGRASGSEVVILRSDERIVPIVEMLVKLSPRDLTVVERTVRAMVETHDV